MSRLSTKQRRARARNRPLRVFFDDYEWWAARDVEHARALQREQSGLDAGEQLSADEWREVPLDATIRWREEDGTEATRTWRSILAEVGGEPCMLGGTET